MCMQMSTYATISANAGGLPIKLLRRRHLEGDRYDGRCLRMNAPTHQLLHCSEVNRVRGKSSDLTKLYCCRFILLDKRTSLNWLA